MIKIIGASMIVLSCSSVGFKLASAYLREERYLKQFIGVLDYMECELQYRLTPLPELCKLAADQCNGALNAVLSSLSNELEAQISPDVQHCMNAAISAHKNLPVALENILVLFGRSLGKFDLQGQIKGIRDVRSECQQNLNKLAENKDTRLRSYRTLAICAGAALAILFI